MKTELKAQDGMETMRLNLESQPGYLDTFRKVNNCQGLNGLPFLPICR